MIRALIGLLALLIVGCEAPLPSSPVPSPSPVAASPVPTPATPSPLFRLYLGDYAPDSDYLAAVLDATAAWEAATRRPLFSWAEGHPVELMQFPVIESGPLTPNKGIGGVTFPNLPLVVFSGQVPIEKRRTVVLHEFGHLIGLKHNENPESVMYPTSNTQVITPADAADAIRVIESEAAYKWSVTGMSSTELTKVLGCLYN